MPTMGSADAVGHALEPAAATVQLSPEAPHQARAVMLDGRPDEDLIAGFLLGYRHRTCAAYLADLRDFCAWCANVGIGLSGARRIHVDGYVRQLEQAGRSRATVARRLATLASFYGYAVQEGGLPTPPSHMSVGPRWRVTRKPLDLTARKRSGSWPRPRPPPPTTTPLPACSP
jgi:integrase